MIAGLKWDILGLGFEFRMLFSGQTFHGDTRHSRRSRFVISVVLCGGGTPGLAWRSSSEPPLAPQKVLPNEQKILSAGTRMLPKLQGPLVTEVAGNRNPLFLSQNEATRSDKVLGRAAGKREDRQACSQRSLRAPSFRRCP